MMAIRYHASPLGLLRLRASGQALLALDFVTEGEPSADPSPLLDEACRQLDDYFAGRRPPFDLPLAPVGTPFQQQVWQALRQIPYGDTCSYRDIACQLGKPGAMRAVGGANHRNPLPLFIPCHRVIGANGSLVGYAGGLALKAWLLTHEAQHRLS